MRTGVARVDWSDGSLSGDGVHESVKLLGDMRHAFMDRLAADAMPAETVLYRVQWVEPAPHEEGGLYWGNTTIEPGRVGDEYFMTHGHLHQVQNRGEFYATISGEGMLVLMSQDRTARTEKVSPGSLHYIPVMTAHRVVNTGNVPLRFVACWPSDAGHAYGIIRERGFSVRILCRNGEPSVARCES